DRKAVDPPDCGDNAADGYADDLIVEFGHQRRDGLGVHQLDSLIESKAVLSHRDQPHLLPQVQDRREITGLVATDGRSHRAAKLACAARYGARWRPTILTGGHHGDSALSSVSQAAAVRASRR